MVNNRPTQQFALPETLKNWPWPRKINPHHEVVKAEATEWLHGFHAFSPKAQAAFDACNFPLYGSLAYHWYDKDRLRTAVDTLILCFVFDEYSDRSNQAEVKGFASIIMDALRNPNKSRPEGESIIGEMFRQFWERSIVTTTPVAQKRFVESMEGYVNAVVTRAGDRDAQHKRTIEEYFDVRRRTIGGMPAFILMQLDLEIPDEIHNHPLMIKLYDWVIDLFILCNDMCSYDREQARGDDIHNIVSIVMHNHNVDIPEALEWVEDYHQKIANNIIEWSQNTPWTSENSPEIAQYTAGVINWVRANDCWHFESHRYFGANGLEIQKTRIVMLSPRIIPAVKEE